MADSTPMPRLTVSSLGVIVALMVSIGNVVWSSAILSNQVQIDHEDIVAIKKELEADRDRRELQVQQLATIEVKLDILLKDREKRQ